MYVLIASSIAASLTHSTPFSIGYACGTATLLLLVIAEYEPLQAQWTYFANYVWNNWNYIGLGADYTTGYFPNVNLQRLMCALTPPACGILTGWICMSTNRRTTGRKKHESTQTDG
ncbi:hypothetical protein RBSH_05662 [Rhodopirellula baltica SH28]|uniref:Uncharacterized protein n=1 Tax=Rhodopirellula baltica SH28 TaxID=993517 RepID=K5CY20_RHOBT|nr:hypothetical protein RBSH_05662 [Rhodopirellula baltica SH28]